MIPVFTICMVVFVIVLKININKNKIAKDTASSDFWEREHEANFARRQDISGLDYISIPLEKFPLNLNTDSERVLRQLSTEKILNLTGISNTDLKLQYGVANLEALTAYDENFTKLVKALASYGHELIDAGQPDEARVVLEYAVSIHADAKAIYTMLANLYLSLGEAERIAGLIASADALNSISKSGIIDALKELQERPNCA
ncbi:MAG: tetratricopeptide repeat protein [Agathobacter sp.]|nr:tetratricopeptide repeat protein [Agathobacter sp.]